MGFEAPGVLLAGVKLDASGYRSTNEGVAFLNHLQSLLATLPGVESVALAENVPLGLSRGSWEIVDVPRYAAAPQEDRRVYRNLVSPGYFSLMRIPLLDGRDFNTADRGEQPFVTIVSEAFARRYFGTAEAVGRSFSIWGGQRTLTVIGIVKDIKVYNLRETALPYYYVPLAQFLSTDTGIAVHVRTRRGNPLLHLPGVRETIRSLDPNVPVFEALSLEDYTSAGRFVQKSAASLLDVVSIVALTLTALGLYGVLSFAVTQRTAEIGIRLALGALPTDVAWLVIKRAGSLVALGFVIGLVTSLGATRVLAAVFYGLHTFEPVVLIAVALPLIFVAALACWLPASHATKVNPVDALRAD